MLRSLKELGGFSIQATDGEIGTVDDFYFEDKTWMIRYLVVDTGHWLPGRRVLISPVAVGRPNWETKKLPVTLSREKVRASPEVETELPILREEETELHEHYFWEPYWLPGLGGVVEEMAGPVELPGAREPEEEPPPTAQAAKDTHLRSVSEIFGYDIEASDGAIGHLEDFLFDEMVWSIRLLAADTGIWIAGRTALIPASRVRQITLIDAMINLDLSKELIESSPAYDPGAPVDEKLEERIIAHYRKGEG